MNDLSLQIFADILYLSERDRVPILPLSEHRSTITVSDAYAIQMKNVDRVVAMGYDTSGKKIGLTSQVMQRQLGATEPDYGHIFIAMDCRDGIVDTTQLIQPKIEAGLAFILGADLVGGRATADIVRAATDYVVCAFEIIDSRVAYWKTKLVDTIADNASSGRYILGDKRLGISDIDLAAVSMKLYKNGVLAEEGTGANVMGDPAIAVAWLANRLWFYGIPLKKGEIILSGAFSAAPDAMQGDVFNAQFSTFGNLLAEFR